MGQGYSGLDGGKVDFDGLFVFRVGIGGIGGPGTVHPPGHVCHGLLVHGENAVLCACFNGHVGDGKAVVHRKGRNAGAGELHGLIECAVHTDHADDVQDHVLAGNPGLEFPGEMELDGGGHLEPGPSGRHTGAHIRGANARGERAQGTVSTGVGVCADATFACGNQALFRQQGMLDAHGAHVEEVGNVVLFRKGAGLEAQLCGVDVLTGGKMVQDDGNLVLVEDLGKAGVLKLRDGNGGGDVVAQHQVQLGLDELACGNRCFSGMGCQDFLGHGHSHSNSSLFFR